MAGASKSELKRGAITGNEAAESPPPKKSALALATNSTPPVTPATSSPPPQPQPSASLLMPPKWMDHNQEVINSLEIVKTFPVDPNSVEYSTLTDLCSPLKVLSIDQIVNPELYAGFAVARRELFRSKSINLPLLSKLGLDAKEIQRIAHISANFDPNPAVASAPYSDNMALLFHCTKTEANLDTILKQGLDERLSNGGCLGRGIYFADNPAKSAGYDGTKGVILICAVLLGDCLSVGGTLKIDRVREPEKSPEQKRHFYDLSFDSIVGHPFGHNEYVIFDRHQCLPLYQVSYQKKGRRNYFSVSSENPVYSKPRLSLPSISLEPEPPSGFWSFFGFSDGIPLPTPSKDLIPWSHLARNVFSRMGVVDDQEHGEYPKINQDASEESAKKHENSTSQDEYGVLLQNLGTLTTLGFTNKVRNTAALMQFQNDLDQAINFLLDVTE